MSRRQVSRGALSKQTGPIVGHLRFDEEDPGLRIAITPSWATPTPLPGKPLSEKGTCL